MMKVISAVSLKRILAMITVVVTTVLFASACDSNVADSDVYKIGICQLVQHESLDSATNGFQDALNITFISHYVLFGKKENM